MEKYPEYELNTKFQQLANVLQFEKEIVAVLDLLDEMGESVIQAMASIGDFAKQTLLMIALQYQKPVICIRLIDMMGKAKFRETAAMQDETGYVALMHAVAQQSSEVVTKMLDLLELNVVKELAGRIYGRSSLLAYALLRQSEEVCLRLIDILGQEKVRELAGTKITEASLFWITVQHKSEGFCMVLMCLIGKERIRELEREMVPDYNPEIPPTLLIAIAKNMSENFCSHLMQMLGKELVRASAEKVDREGNTTLMCALLPKQPHPITEQLLKIYKKELLQKIVLIKNGQGHSVFDHGRSHNVYLILRLMTMPKKNCDWEAAFNLGRSLYRRHIDYKCSVFLECYEHNLTSLVVIYNLLDDLKPKIIRCLIDYTDERYENNERVKDCARLTLGKIYFLFEKDYAQARNYLSSVKHESYIVEARSLLRTIANTVNLNTVASDASSETTEYWNAKQF